MSESLKPCTCKVPDIKQGLPVGFKGKVVCLNCKGVLDFPRPETKYEGNDEIEGFLFDLNKNSSGMTFEKAMLKMLLRIEKSIIGTNEKDNKKVSK